MSAVDRDKIPRRRCRLVKPWKFGIRKTRELLAR